MVKRHLPAHHGLRDEEVAERVAGHLGNPCRLPRLVEAPEEGLRSLVLIVWVEEHPVVRRVWLGLRLRLLDPDAGRARGAADGSADDVVRDTDQRAAERAVGREQGPPAQPQAAALAVLPPRCGDWQGGAAHRNTWGGARPCTGLPAGRPHRPAPGSAYRRRRENAPARRSSPPEGRRRGSRSAPSARWRRDRAPAGGARRGRPLRTSRLLPPVVTGLSEVRGRRLLHPLLAP